MKVHLSPPPVEFSATKPEDPSVFAPPPRLISAPSTSFENDGCEGSGKSQAARHTPELGVTAVAAAVLP